MNKVELKNKKNKLQRKARVRAKIFGTAKRPRLSIFRSNKGLYLQLIDDGNSKTLVSVNIKELKDKKKTVASEQAGKLLAEKSIKAGIKEAIFDRSSYKYHGRVKAVAEAARKAGLKI